MYKNHKIIALIPAYNEENRIGRVVDRVDHDVVDTLLVIDDGSTDATAEIARKRGASVLSLGRVYGVGAALRRGIEHGRHTKHDIAVFIAGNDKDDPAQVPRLLDPICSDGYDLVMGSRHMKGGAYGGAMPLYRKWATRLHPWLMGKLAGKHLTESTNGFRAFRLAMLDDERINLRQSWLDGYGLEVYLLWKVIKLGYRHKEVPCTKIYPPKNTEYTKMKPVIGWWSILQPVFLLSMGIRR